MNKQGILIKTEHSTTVHICDEGDEIQILTPTEDETGALVIATITVGENGFEFRAYGQEVDVLRHDPSEETD